MTLGTTKAEVISNATLVYMTDGTGEGTEKMTDQHFVPLEDQLMSDGCLALQEYNQNASTDQV